MGKYLNEFEANKLLSSVSIPMAMSRLCKTIDEAKIEAREIGFPVVMKILSPDILHKTEAGCVFIGIKNAEDVEKKYNRILENAKDYKPNAKIDGVLVQEMAPKGLELIIGMKHDPQFGPVIIIGSGGIYVEVYKDVSLRLIPIDRLDAKEMIKETKIYDIIKGARGTKYDLEVLIDSLMKLSKLAFDNKKILEIDINPFFLYEEGEGGKGVDALIKVSDM